MSQREVEQPVARGKGRLEAIDLARGFALLAMAIYHFAWDLEFFGYVEPGTTQVGGWRFFARSIATSFLFLVGASLVLAHAKGVNWKSFAKRIAMVAGAAGAITLATWIAVPDAFIFFGILHHIALASVLGLAFLRMPLALVLIAAALVFAAPHFLRMPFFDHPALWWLGLAPQNPRSNDYVPWRPSLLPCSWGSPRHASPLRPGSSTAYARGRPADGAVRCSLQDGTASWSIWSISRS
jgi:uncharacterized membrane protein